MSLRNQPYFPLYIQDYLTDEKLNECSAQAQGVYVKLMCLMHKSDDYGKILLKQKDKQNTNQILNFARKIVKHLPFKEQVISSSIEELLEEKVLFIEGDYLCQKRMIKDNELSIKRSKAGKKGGKTTQHKNLFAKANNEASYEYEIEYEYENIKIKKVEKQKLIEKYGLNSYLWMIGKLANYKLSSGKEYKSDYGAINSWVVKEWKKEKATKEEAKTGAESYLNF